MIPCQHLWCCRYSRGRKETGAWLLEREGFVCFKAYGHLSVSGVVQRYICTRKSHCNRTQDIPPQFGTSLCSMPVTTKNCDVNYGLHTGTVLQLRMSRMHRMRCGEAVLSPFTLLCANLYHCPDGEHDVASGPAPVFGVPHSPALI